MFNPSRFQEALAAFKRDFTPTHWAEEKYKWEAVRWFQDHWDENAADFASMLNTALEKTANLLASANNFPKAMILGFAKKDPEAARAMFAALFDESKDAFDRINAFKQQASVLLGQYGDGAVQHYQNENAVSTYLWLRYPDRYYIYKYSEIKAVAEKLEAECSFRQGAYADNIRNFLKLYDAVSAALKADEALEDLFYTQLTDSCYPDPQFKTLTIDFGFYISRHYSQGKDDPDSQGWYGTQFDTGLTVEDWTELLKNESVFNKNALELMKCMRACGGKATCKQLSEKYGKSTNFYINASVALAKRICRAKGIEPDVHENGKDRWWTILYKGREAEKGESGTFVWQLRDELSKALSDMDEPGYWWLNADPQTWGFSDLAVGDTRYYTFYNDNGNKRRIYQNYVDAKVGDPVIGYESSTKKRVVALARVSAKQDGESLTFEKVETLSTPIEYATLKACPELADMEYFQSPQGSLFKLRKDEYDFILGMIHGEKSVSADNYAKCDFLSEVYMTEKHYDALVNVLHYKKNIILQGAPGVGKTFAAKRLAWSLMGEKDDSRIEFVQFHQNYSYEDFVMGYKPVQDGFELRDGIFYRFCQKAADHPDKDFFFIIDEINRGNMSKIFGELLMLIEKDYRGRAITLAYNERPFSVPENMYIIGMMNTADRSLAMIDYALRRRFGFFEIEPGFDSEGFIRYKKGLNNETMNVLIEQVKELNREIARDQSLGKGFCIGHSYFCGRNADNCTEEWLHAVVDYEILPMLSEYWFDETSKLQHWEKVLQGVFQ